MIKNYLVKIPFSRALLYALFLFLVPSIFVLLYLINASNRQETIKEQIESIKENFILNEKKQALNLATIQNFKESDHFYIDKNIETLPLLQEEILALKKISLNSSLGEDEVIKKRLDFLSSGGNSLHFAEGVVQTHPLFQETIETLQHPVEVSLKDIKRILSLIEGSKIGEYSPAPLRPQLIILDFKIDKKKSIDKNEVYGLQLKLLKREFL